MKPYPKLKTVAVFWRDAYSDSQGNDISTEFATDSLTMGWLIPDYVDELGIRYVRVMQEIDELGREGSTGNVIYIPKKVIQRILLLGELDTETETFKVMRKK